MNIIFGLLIGTAVIWALTYLIVMPISEFLTNRRIAKPTDVIYLPQKTGTIDSKSLEEIITSRTNDYPFRKERIYNRIFIITDVVVLGIAGFLMGFMIGWYFIGITWKARSIPAMLTFIGLSFAGAYLHS